MLWKVRFVWEAGPIENGIIMFYGISCIYLHWREPLRSHARSEVERSDV